MCSFYRNMKLLSNCPWLHACLYKTLVTFASFEAVITFAAFVKFIPTNLGIFQLGKVFFTKVSPCMHLSVLFICIYIQN